MNRSNVHYVDSGSEGASDMAFDPAGNIYLTGRTLSADFPTTPGAFDRVYSADSFIAGADAWVAKVSFGPGTPLPSPTASPSPSPPVGQPLPAPSLVSPGNDARFSPGATITFDWTDVTGAASYRLQIDNSDSFQAPFTREVTVTESLHVAGGLPTQRMWWRVRAVAADGTPGAWSSGRRFELRN